MFLIGGWITGGPSPPVVVVTVLVRVGAPTGLRAPGVLLVLVPGACDSSMVPQLARIITAATTSAIGTLFDVNPFHRLKFSRPIVIKTFVGARIARGR
jgi:hypothetical protein